MHPLEKRLYNDHAHFELLLRCLEHRTVTNQTRDTWRSDLPIILDALDYIKNYPELWHHPVEDKIFSYIAQRHPNHTNKIDFLKKEHQKLEGLTVRLTSLFATLDDSEEFCLDELTSTMCEFLQCQSDHLEYENLNIYPLMTRYLHEQDWRTLSESISEVNDPLFGSLLLKYEALFCQIMAVENTQFLDV